MQFRDGDAELPKRHPHPLLVVVPVHVSADAPPGFADMYDVPSAEKMVSRMHGDAARGRGDESWLVRLKPLSTPS